MSKAAALVVATLGAGAAAWLYMRRQQASAGSIVADNFGFLDDGSGIFANDDASQDAGSSGSGGIGEMFAGAADTVLTAIDGALMTVGLSLSGGRWLTVIQRPENASLYQAMLSAETQNSIPSHMLVRLAYKESSYNVNATNPSGAQGIMQIIPRWHPGVNPFDPYAAIAYAGRYLSDQFKRFGTWERALQAYNWGPNALASWLATGKPAMPFETSNYSKTILADLGITPGIA